MIDTFSCFITTLAWFIPYLSPALSSIQYFHRRFIMASVATPFDSVPEAPPDVIFGVLTKFRADESADKINLSVGAYRTSEGKPYVLKAVREAEKKLVNDDSLNKEYLPIDGLPSFLKVSTELLYGADSPAVKEKRLAIAQSISGTGALRVGAEMIANFFPKGTTVYVSDPTWGNHFKIFANAGVKTAKYRYFDDKTKGLAWKELQEDLEKAPSGSVVLLHAVAHNPTGVDLTPAQWGELDALLVRKNLFPFFDCAYQGFASGNPERDIAAVRLFVERGRQLMLAQSYAKNMGLYSERVGTISAVCGSQKAAEAVQSQLKAIIRAMYSNPPRNGAYIVSTVLSDPALKKQWDEEVEMMANRIRDMRLALFKELERLKTPGSWQHILDQIGMFSYTGLSGFC